MARRILWGSLALAPVTILVDLLTGAGKVTLFVLAAISLVPLAWLIGEATEHAAEYTGPAVGGLLNASFGNAPELIIALLAVADNLPEVVRGSLSGSVISNLLLVFGVTQLVGAEAAINRRSLLVQLALVAAAVVVLVAPVALGYTGNPERHSVVGASIPVAVGLLGLYLLVTIRNLQEQHAGQREHEPAAGSWSLPISLAALGGATVVTAVISEILVHSLDAFARAIGATEFFIAAVVVAIVGNAAEHGGAIVIARGGKMKLASEIAVSSSAQVALLVAPVVMLLSLFFSHHLPLSFRWQELAAMGGATVFAALTVRDGHTRRREGALLVGAYAALVVAFWFVSPR